MTFELIDAFIKLVEFKNFTRAAEELCISQSALSHRLNLLEEEVGLQLIRRSRGNRSLTLTQAGTEFIEIANQWLNLSRKTQNFKSDYRKRRLSVANIESIALIFSPFYNQLVVGSNRDSQISLDIHVFPSPQILEAIENFEIDIGFTSLQSASQNLKVVPIFREKHYLVGNLTCEDPILDPRILDPDLELLTNWSTDFLSWHDQYLGPPTKALLCVDTAVLTAPFLNPGAWCVVPACAVSFLQRSCLLYGHSVRVYEIQNPPPDRICYQVTHLFPRANRIENIRYLEAKLRNYLGENNFHL